MITQCSKDHLKINVGIDNFPWVNHDYVQTLNETLPIAVSNNASWLSVWWNIEGMPILDPKIRF